MNLAEFSKNFWDALKSFWNALGVDCPDEVKIESDGSILAEELKASEERVEKIAKGYFSTNKAGKGRKPNKLDVPTVTSATEAVKAQKSEAQESKEQKPSKKQDVEMEI